MHIKNIITYLLLIVLFEDISTGEYDIGGDIEKFYKIGNLSATSNCRRECKHGEPPKMCYFKFNVEHYHAMGVACGNCATGVFQDCFNPQCITADGQEKGVTVANRQLTGPSIQVCKNDVIIVDVVNKMQGLTVTIHWHGILQRGTQHMDGVPGVTQCAILPETSFRYIFFTPNSGTYFWHSHSGFGRTSGLYGDLIIREPIEGNPHSHLYKHDKYEHVILVSDWSIEMPEMFVPGLSNRFPRINPSNLLINGKGTAIVDETTGERTRVPYKIFKVQFGQTYRFRIINGGTFFCPIQFQIFNHQMTIIETDGNDCIAKVVDTIVFYSGERYSFILQADQPPGLYWMRITALGPCAVIFPIQQFAILAYEEALPSETSTKQQILPNDPEPAITNPWPSAVTLNPLPCISSDSSICITDLRAMNVDQEVLTDTPDLRLYLNFGFFNPNATEFFSTENYIHHIAFRTAVAFPHMNFISNSQPSSPLLTQWIDSVPTDTCSTNKLPAACQGQTVCHCPHVIKIFKNAIIEIVLSSVDLNAGVSHSFHLHGYNFYILEEGLNPTVAPESYVPKTFSVGPLKDSLNIRPFGYSVIRFRADNPGFWLFHCHFEYHMAGGMSVILQVGDHTDFPPIPPGFPKCRDFLPTIMFKDD